MHRNFQKLFLITFLIRRHAADRFFDILILFRLLPKTLSINNFIGKHMSFECFIIPTFFKAVDKSVDNLFSEFFLFEKHLVTFQTSRILRSAPLKQKFENQVQYRN
jgi:hypothetical protein